MATEHRARITARIIDGQQLGVVNAQEHPDRVSLWDVIALELLAIEEEMLDELPAAPATGDTFYWRPTDEFYKLGVGEAALDDELTFTGTFMAGNTIPPGSLAALQGQLKGIDRQLTQSLANWSRSYKGKLKKDFDQLTKRFLADEIPLSEFQAAQHTLVKRGDKARLGKFDREQAHQRELMAARSSRIVAAQQSIWLVRGVRGLTVDQGDYSPWPEVRANMELLNPEAVANGALASYVRHIVVDLRGTPAERFQRWVTAEREAKRIRLAHWAENPPTDET